MINHVYYLISDSNLPIIPMLYDDIIAKLTSLKFKKDLIFFKVQTAAKLHMSPTPLS